MHKERKKIESKIFINLKYRNKESLSIKSFITKGTATIISKSREISNLGYQPIENKTKCSQPIEIFYA